ncbi:hypothetical protein ACIQFZ_08820 [Streptomyces sp. NPDC093064]|uniref:hypothetical protein n=1 Tax=Streptomyces sp. NPDC093064 TaxID=3366020 RepID=UPI003820EE2B
MAGSRKTNEDRHQADHAVRGRHEEVRADMSPLQALGLSATAEAVYLVLVQQGPQTFTELSNRPTLVRSSVEGLQGAVTALSDIGLVSRTDDRLTAQPPRARLEAAAERHAREARIAYESAMVLSRFWLDHTAGSSYVEVVDTSERPEAVWRRVHDEAVTEVRALWIGPVGGGGRVPETDTYALQALARGIAYRVVYSASILRDPTARMPSPMMMLSGMPSDSGEPCSENANALKVNIGLLPPWRAGMSMSALARSSEFSGEVP